jgi:hypothetical protein
MTALAVLVVVVIASDLGIEIQLIGKECAYRLITGAADTAKQLDAGTRKSHLCAASDTAADKYRYVLLREKSRQRTVTATARADHLGGYYRSVFHRIDFKLLGVSEMLKDLSVFISYCNFHYVISIS